MRGTKALILKALVDNHRQGYSRIEYNGVYDAVVFSPTLPGAVSDSAVRKGLNALAEQGVAVKEKFGRAFVYGLSDKAIAALKEKGLVA